MLINKNAARIASFVDGTFLPSYEGATQRFVNLSAGLAKRNVHVVIFHIYRGWSDLDQIRKQPFRTYIIEPIKFYHNFESIIDLIKKEDINIVQFVDYERILQYGKMLKQKLPNVKICYEAHDVITDFLKTLNKQSQEIEAAKKNLVDALTFCDHVICFTEYDKSSFVKIGYNEENISIIPCGTNMRAIRYVGTKALSKRNILFLGNFYHEPNRKGLEDILTRILPLLNEGVHESEKVNLIVAGDAPKITTDLLKDKPHISYLGKINDLNNVFEMTSVAICPITTGSGMRIKVLDYISAGLPVVTTEMGVRELGLESGAIFENNIDQFAEKIRFLLDINNQSHAEQLSKDAYKAAHNLSWDNITVQAEVIYHSIAGKRSKPLPAISNKLINQIGEPYYINDFIKLKRFENKVPIFENYKYGILQNGKISLK